MVECLFCRHLMYPDQLGAGDWHGHPCHLACSDWLTEAAKQFSPVNIEDHPSYDLSHRPVTYGWCGASFQDYDYEWHTLEESLKERLYEQYLRALTSMLQQQEVAIRAYCDRHGLPEPKIIKELKQSTQHMTEVYRLMDDRGIKPGDHLVIAVLPRSQRHRHKSAQLTRNIAKNMAKKGVTFHSAFAGIDWSKPVGQAAVNMAVNVQLWQDTIFRDAVEYNAGKIYRLYGYTWSQIAQHQTFQWVVRYIRDMRMSPAEVWNASRRYYSVHAYVPNNKRWWNLLITRDRFLAWEERKKNHYYCNKHKKVSLLSRCQICDMPGQFVKTVVSRGVNLFFTRRDWEDEYMYSQLWSFYCDHHPEQERQPWLTRSRFPELLVLQDLKMVEAKEWFDKE